MMGNADKQILKMYAIIHRVHTQRDIQAGRQIQNIRQKLFSNQPKK